MSEPMSSGEIEDVLSSIRRLVSEDLRPASRQPGAKPAVPQPSGKLLLTPALRVVSSELETGPVAEAVSSMTVDAVPQQGPFGGEDVLTEDDAAEDAFAEDMRAAEAEAHSVPDDASDAVSAEDWLPEADEGRAGNAGYDWHDDTAEDSADADASAADLTRVVSQIGAAVAETDEDWEPETWDMQMPGLSWQAPEWVEEAEIVDEGAEGEADALSAAVAKSIADEAEAAAVAEIMARAAQAKAEAEAKAAEAQKAEDPLPEEDIFAEDEGYFDETVLRDLVRDLIREELSGTLGERITRNVRKLVRAEINRAFTARDFD